MDKEQLYLRLPTWLQNLVVGIEGRRISRHRYNRTFESLLSQYEARTYEDTERLLRHRDDRLQCFVKHAAETVPYYRELFETHGLVAGDIRSLEDLAKLPVLTKLEVQKNASLFHSDVVPGSGVSIHHTSGSTGTGLHFPMTHDAERAEWAVWWRYRQWHELNRNEPCLYFGGRSVVPLTQKQPPFWRYNRPGRQILFSGYHLGPGTAPSYLDEIRRSKSRWIHGYPSMVSLIAQYALRFGVKLDIRWVTTGAESLLPQQAIMIEKAFGIRPIEHYGMAEGVANISQCPRGNLHVDEDFAAVEFLPLTNGSHKIVGTNFTNPAFPLLRYDVGDTVTSTEQTCDCGRPGRIVERVDGRKEDYIITRRGNHLGRLDHIFKDCVNVCEAQIRQSEAGRMSIHVVRGIGYGERDEQLLVQEITKRVGDELDFDIAYTDHIPRTKRGKLRFVVSSVASNVSKAA